MSANEVVIRDLAYQIWETEGKPEGQSERHWKQATILAESEIDSTHEELEQSIDPSEPQGSIEPPQPDQT